ncbi:hypothetical protein Tco_0599802 [Tanacetum coccineum]
MDQILYTWVVASKFPMLNLGEYEILRMRIEQYIQMIDYALWEIIKNVTVAGARETVGSQVVQQTGIQCSNCKEFGHFAKECRKPKRVKDYTYHKEKMLLCKQAEKGVPLQAEQADWLEDTDEEIDEQELEAHYSYMERFRGSYCRLRN